MHVTGQLPHATCILVVSITSMRTTAKYDACVAEQKTAPVEQGVD